MTDKLKNIILLLICLLATNMSFGQRERTANWYFGYNAGLKFLPTVASDSLGQIFTWEGCASISDSCGNLLFYSDGSTVYNKNHSIMTNGTGLEGDFSSTQSAIIIPKPQNDSIYYLFTTGGSSGNYSYSEINMNLNAGLGAVSTKNNFLCFNYYNQKQAAIMHCNNQDVWVVCGDSTGNYYYSYLINNSGVSLTPVISSIGISIGGLGYMKFSPNGSYLANANSFTDSLSISYFNNCTGQASAFVSCHADTCVYGLSFSNNSTKLYAANTWCTNTKSDLWQYDLSSGIPNSIISSKTLIKHLPDSLFYGALQLGADNKIYVSKYKYGPMGLNYLATINNPNALGISCNYSDSTVSLDPRTNVVGLPNFIESYFNTNYSCPNITNIKSQNNFEIVQVHPNPFSTVTTISISDKTFRKYEFRLYDNMGLLKRVLILSNGATELNRKELASGLYFYQVVSENKLLDNGKLIIE